MPLNLKSVANGSVILNPASTVTDKTITLPATDGTMVVQDGTNTTTLTNLAYTGTLTGGTGVINIGSGQVYKDASGNVGVGTSSPQAKLSVSNSGAAGFEFFTNYPGGGVGTYIQSYNRSSPGYVSTAYDAADHAFRTNGTERMRIDSSGNLLVGTTNNASSARAFFEQTTANPAITTFVNRVSSQGNPGISVVKRDNDNSTAQIYASFIFNNFANGAGGIQGNGATGAQFFSSSDARLKENVQELEPQLPNIMALKPSKFDYIDGPKGCTGFIAQEMEQVYPDAIGETPDGYKTIGGISIMEARLVKAIQELKAEFDAYKLSHP